MTIAEIWMRDLKAGIDIIEIAKRDRVRCDRIQAVVARLEAERACVPTVETLDQRTS